MCLNTMIWHLGACFIRSNLVRLSGVDRNATFTTIFLADRDRHHTGSRALALEAIGQVDTPRERLVGFDASETGLGLILREHALQLGVLVSEVVDERRGAPLIMKFNSRSDIDQVIPGQLSVRAGELVRVGEKNRV